MNEEDKAQGWRKRQAEELRNEFVDFKEAISGEKFEAWRQEKIKETSEERVKLKDAFQRESRNNVLEEVALEFDKMKMFGDTAASFAAFVRNMKK
jgi:hypothetical protein